MTNEATVVEEELKKHPSEASSKEVLELEPNTAEAATSGPHDQVSQTAYVTWTKPDGSSFIAPLSNSETYERLGYKAGKGQEVDDLVAWNTENATREAPSAHATRGEHAEKPKAS